MRVIIAIILGFVLWSALWITTNSATMAAVPGWFGPEGRVTSTAALSLFVALSFVYSVIAGFFTAWIARRGEVRNGLGLGMALLAVGIVMTAVNYNTAPFWFHATFLALLIPGTVLGAGIRRGYREAGPTPGEVL
ncbi:MAG: hypothetical protein ABR543_06750 [Gemmatimonadaceae bacterium]